MDFIKIAIVGDSISEGLGSKKYNYVNSLKENLKKAQIESDIKNFAVSGTTIDYAIDKIEEINRFNPDYLFIFYGNVEAIIRPDLRKETIITTLLPKRYHKMFMLDPRPFFSKNIFKSFIQHMDNIYRFFMRRVVCKLNGTYRLMEPNEFADKYDYFIREMKLHVKNIVCISNVRIDERYFPGTTLSLDEFRLEIQRISNINNTMYVALNEWQKQFFWKCIYGNDHYHPSKDGYEQMGEFFANQILNKINKEEKDYARI